MRPKHFTGAQKHALKIAAQGSLNLCGRSYRGADGGLVRRATALSLVSRGWLVVAAKDGHGQPTCIEHVGAQIGFPFVSGEVSPGAGGD